MAVDGAAYCPSTKCSDPCLAPYQEVADVFLFLSFFQKMAVADVSDGQKHSLPDRTWCWCKDPSHRTAHSATSESDPRLQATGPDPTQHRFPTWCWCAQTHSSRLHRQAYISLTLSSRPQNPRTHPYAAAAAMVTYLPACLVDDDLCNHGHDLTHLLSFLVAGYRPGRRRP